MRLVVGRALRPLVRHASTTVARGRIHADKRAKRNKFLCSSQIILRDARGLKFPKGCFVRVGHRFGLCQALIPGAGARL